MVAQIMNGDAPTPHFKPGDQGLKGEWSTACRFFLNAQKHE